MTDTPDYANNAIDPASGPGPESLRPSSLVDSAHPAVQAFANEHAKGSSDRERAVALYLAVRDGFRYDPYLSLCEKFGLLPLEFNGVDDSIYRPFDRSGNRHMEYLRQHGSFNDVPLGRVIEDFARYYPGMDQPTSALRGADFDADVFT